MDNMRRNLLKLAGFSLAAGSTSVIPSLTRLGEARAAPGDFQVIVIGGGFGGSTAAKYLKLWGQGRIAVTHIDVNTSYASPILSNLVLNGQKTVANLTFSLSNAATRLGINFVQGLATLDRASHLVQVNKPDGGSALLNYDKVVVSPGVDFNMLASMVAANGTAADGRLPIPHAWKSGAQVTNLKAQINQLPRGTGRVVLCIPKAPYRCPPGPYERACVIADILQRVKGGGKLIVFDANAPLANDPDGIYSAIQAERHTFKTAFTGIYAKTIEYVPNATLLEVAARGGQYGTKTARVRLGDGSERSETCRVLNVLPEHRAGQLLFDAGLVPNGRFAPVDLQSYASLVDPDIHVLGDAHQSSQPKAGHIANSEAKVCADAIVREFGILPPRVPDEVPVTNSACYSPISATTASWLSVGYRYNPSTQAMERIAISQAEAARPSGDNYKTMLSWANNLFADSFSL